MNGKTIIFKKLTVEEKAGAQAGQITPPEDPIVQPLPEGINCTPAITDCQPPIAGQGISCLSPPQPDCFTGGGGIAEATANNICD